MRLILLNGFMKIGKKRKYIAMLEKGETDMLLSTFIMISEAVWLKFDLTY